MMTKKLIAVLLSATTLTAFAQEKNSKKESYHIKIVKEENGKTVSIDTTFSTSESLNTFLKQHNISDPPQPPAPPAPPAAPAPPDAPAIPDPANPPMAPGANLPPLKLDLDLSISQSEMDNLKNELEKLGEELKKFRFELYTENEDGDKQEDVKVFKFNGDSLLEFNFNDKDWEKNFKCLDSLDMHFNFNYSTDEGENKHLKKSVVIIRESKDDKKSRKNKNKKIIQEERKTTSDYSLELQGFSISPNPSTGKIALVFSSKSQSPVSIAIYDSNGSEVFSEKLKNFKGTYSGEINLEGKSKGTYIVKIKQDNKWLTKQLILN